MPFRKGERTGSAGFPGLFSTPWGSTADLMLEGAVESAVADLGIGEGAEGPSGQPGGIPADGVGIWMDGGGRFRATDDLLKEDGRRTVGMHWGSRSQRFGEDAPCLVHDVFAMGRQYLVLFQPCETAPPPAPAAYPALPP